MKRSFLGKLQRTAWQNVSGALLLLLLVPALLLLVLAPQGYDTALAAPRTLLVWLGEHTPLFLLYRGVFILGFALLLGLPFALFRIIIAQEIVGRAEMAEPTDAEEREDEEAEQAGEQDRQTKTEPQLESNGMPAFAWRGKGFAVIAAWTGLPALLLMTGGLLVSTIYLWSSAGVVTPQAPVPDNFATVTSLFSVLTYTLGGGLLALSCIFFGLVIARSGRKLWPDSWVAFGYTALVLGAIASGSAVQVALAPASEQATLTTPTILLFALWSLWFGVMVVRLKAE